MKHKRLDRNAWGFQGFPYYQTHIDFKDFHGIVSIIKIISGDYFYWEMPKAGKAAITGAGMTWLQMVPDNSHRAVTAKFIPREKCIDGTTYPFSISVWYADIIEDLLYDDDGVAVFVDKYLDIIFSPYGDIKVDDQNELDEAYSKGELSKEQYNAAIKEGLDIIRELCENYSNTEKFHCELLTYLNKQIDDGTLSEFPKKI